jgi:hypothetical protein
MNVAAPQSPLLRWAYGGYMLAFFFYLAAPLATAAVFAFNDSLFPALPWNDFTLDWFFGSTEPKLGMVHDRRLMEGLGNSFFNGAIVSVPSVAAGTCNAFLFERNDFPGKLPLHSDDRAAGDSGRHSRHLHPGFSPATSPTGWKRVSASNWTSCVPAPSWSCSANSLFSPPLLRS